MIYQNIFLFERNRLFRYFLRWFFDILPPEIPFLFGLKGSVSRISKKDKISYQNSAFLLFEHTLYVIQCENCTTIFWISAARQWHFNRKRQRTLLARSELARGVFLNKFSSKIKTSCVFGRQTSNSQLSCLAPWLQQFLRELASGLVIMF